MLVPKPDDDHSRRILHRIVVADSRHRGVKPSGRGRKTDGLRIKCLARNLLQSQATVLEGLLDTWKRCDLGGV
jgi:hypothetical protein